MENKQLFVFAMNYNPLKKEDEMEVTQISIPADAQDEAVARLKAMVGAVMAKKFFLNDIQDY